MASADVAVRDDPLDGAGSVRQYVTRGEDVPTVEWARRAAEIRERLERDRATSWALATDAAEAAPAEQPAPRTEPDAAAPPPRRGVLRLSDVGNARRLVKNRGADMHFVPQWNRWLVWDGTRWTRDTTGTVDRFARDATLDLFRVATDLRQTHLGTELWHHAKRSESDFGIRSMLARAAKEPTISVGADKLDADPWLVSCPNGTLDLRTGTLREHRRDDLITRSVDVPFRPKARATHWRAFLKRMFDGDKALVAFVQRALGYSLTGDTCEQCVFVLLGTGANGKSTLLNAMHRVLGSYAAQTPTDTLLVRRTDTAPSGVARLRGVRLVCTAEVDPGRRLDEVLLKQMTGGDVICARFPYGRWFEFRAQFKLWVAANHKPRISGADAALWRRIRVVPCAVTIPEGEQDKHLGEALAREAPGILAWAVRGCLEWQREGLEPPPGVRHATDDYRAEVDELGGFLRECCTVGPHTRATAKALRTAYEGWCEANAFDPVTPHRLGRLLRDHGLAPVKHCGERAWEGLTLADPA